MAFEKTKHFKVNFVPKDQWELKFNGIMHKSTNSFSNVIKKRMKIVKEKYEGCPRHAGSDEYLDIFS